jgi:hypothetical protein
VIRLARSSVLALALASCAACAQATSPTPSTSTVDVLTYIIGDASVWPRSGSHAQNQIVDLSRREVCWVKYGNPRRFECWRWDDRYVYHAVDHGLDGDSNESYMLTDGRWIDRFIPAGSTPALPWSLDIPNNQLVWFDAACHVDASKSHAFPYRQRAWFEPQRDAGGTLGPRETLVLEYQPYDPAGGAGAPEHFYFGLAVGWYEWERAGFHDFFNRTPGFNTPMDRSVWCQAP